MPPSRNHPSQYGARPKEEPISPIKAGATGVLFGLVMREIGKHLGIGVGPFVIVSFPPTAKLFAIGLPEVVKLFGGGASVLRSRSHHHWP